MADDRQLSLDFASSFTQRQRRAQDRLFTQELLFVSAVLDVDISLHNPWEAIANLGGDVDAAKRWLERVVGPIQQLKGRKYLLPATALDRLLHVRPPTKVTLDAATLTVARALWARKLGYGPLVVRKHRQRLLVSSPSGPLRWPSGMVVRDGPWTAVACLAHMGVPLAVADAGAAALLAQKVGSSGGYIGEAGVAGSTIYIHTNQPQVVEQLGLPALAYAGPVNSGMYRLPVLVAEPLLHETSIRLTPDARSAIKRLTGDVTPLQLGDDFPWKLYPFQARDAAVGLRILESTGGVLLAGDMGSGKALSTTTLVLTPSGAKAIGELVAGDEVLGKDGRAHLVKGVYPQGEVDLFKVAFGDGHTVLADGEHYWEVCPTDDLSEGSSSVVHTTNEIRETLYNAEGKSCWRVPLVTAPLEFHHSQEVAAGPYTLGVTLGATTHIDRGLAEDSRSNSSVAAFVPDAYLYAPLDTRLNVLCGLLDVSGVADSTVPGQITFSSTSKPLCDNVQWLVETCGGTATVARSLSGRFRRPAPARVTTAGSDGSCWQTQLFAPQRVLTRLRTLKNVAFNQVECEMHRAVVSIEPAGRGQAVCIQVDSDDNLFLLNGAIPTHNTTVSLGLAHHLDLFPILIAAPLSAFSTWARQLGEMNKSFYLASEPTKVAWERLSTDHSLDAVVISYDRLHAFIEILETIPFKGIISDELQKTSSPNSRRSRALRQLAQHLPVRIGLSGTPMNNYLADLLPLGSFLVPGEWKPRATSKDLSDLYPGDPVESLADHLGSMMVRRRIDEVGVELPDKTIRRVFVQLTAEQRRALDDLKAESEREVEEGDTERMHVFAKLQRMRQIISSPSTAGVPGPNPKIQMAIELAEQFSAMGRKSVLFAVNRQSWIELGEGCEKAGMGWVGVWGSTPVAERIVAEKRFHTDDNVRCFIGTIQSCAEAITLSPTGSAAIFTGYVYNPSQAAQAEARIYRLNQTNACDIIYLHAQAPGGTLDDRFVDILEAKRVLISQVVDRREHIDTTEVHYSTGDLVFLLTGKRDEKLDQHEADKKAEAKRAEDKKRHAKASAHKRKYKNDVDVYLEDDGKDLGYDPDKVFSAVMDDEEMVIPELDQDPDSDDVGFDAGDSEDTDFEE